jgi:membrane protease YdiL (CAAX protease family)
VKLPLNLPTLNAKYLNIGLWIFVGLSLPILTVAIFYITGNLSMRRLNTELSQSYILDTYFKALGVCFACGFVEEIVFRCYLFNLLKSKYNFWISAF